MIRESGLTIIELELELELELDEIIFCRFICVMNDGQLHVHVISFIKTEVIFI